MRSLVSFGTITRFSRIFRLVRVRMESTRAIVLTFVRDTRQVVQRFTHIIRQIGNSIDWLYVSVVESDLCTSICRVIFFIRD